MPSLRYPTTPSVQMDLLWFMLAVLLFAGAAATLLARLGILLQSLLVAGLIAALVWQNRPNRLGPADRITLLRAAGVAALAGLPFQVELAGATLWIAAAIAGLLLLMDGFDGAVARRTGTSSGFGARFDMELDAFFILVLCLLVWQGGEVGPWVLLIGLLRYLFVAAGLLLPALAEPLPGSLRRKIACVVQVVALLLSLAPLTTARQAEIIALTALLLLIYSFAVDTRWLLRTGTGRKS